MKRRQTRAGLCVKTIASLVAGEGTLNNVCDLSALTGEGLQRGAGRGPSPGKRL